MNKLTKKFLLSFSLGLAAVGSVVPVAMTTTSCQSEDSSFSWKSLIGKMVSISTKIPYYSSISGIVLNVDSKHIYVDGSSGFSKIISVPKDIEEVTFYKEQYYSKEVLYPILESMRESFVKSVNYFTTMSYIEDLIHRIADPQGKKLGEEMLSIFKSHMTYLTVEKIDEALVDLQQNNSLRKWQKLIDYYINSFPWYRDKFLQKYHEVETKYNVAMSTEELNSLKEICSGYYNIVAYTCHMKLI